MLCLASWLGALLYGWGWKPDPFPGMWTLPPATPQIVTKAQQMEAIYSRQDTGELRGM